MSLNIKHINEILYLSDFKEGQDLFKELVGSFRANGPHLVFEIKKNFPSSLPQVETAAHKLKSSAGNIGLRNLSELSADIMNAAMEKDTITLSHLVPKVEDTLKVQLKELDTFLFMEGLDQIKDCA